MWVRHLYVFCCIISVFKLIRVTCFRCFSTAVRELSMLGRLTSTWSASCSEYHQSCLWIYESSMLRKALTLKLPLKLKYSCGFQALKALTATFFFQAPSGSRLATLLRQAPLHLPALVRQTSEFRLAVSVCLAEHLLFALQTIYSPLFCSHERQPSLVR